MRLRPIRPPSVDDIVDVASAHGLRCLHDGHMPRRTFTQSPASAAGLLESRAWSWCWELSDDVWAEIVPVINNLRTSTPSGPRALDRLALSGARTQGELMKRYEVTPIGTVESPTSLARAQAGG